MYTVAMRPCCSSKFQNNCMVYTQEKCKWEPATGEWGREDVGEDYRGVYFHFPLGAVDITMAQLTAMLAGLMEAYEVLCNTLYAGADKALVSRGEWQSLGQYMSCMPILKTPRELILPPPIVSTDDFPYFPFIYYAPANALLVYNGTRWGTMECTPERMATYKVMCESDAKPTVIVRSPEFLARALGSLLSTLWCNDTDAKIYTEFITMAAGEVFA